MRRKKVEAVSEGAEQILDRNWESGEVTTKHGRIPVRTMISKGPLLVGLHRCTTTFRKRAAISAAPLAGGKVLIRSRI